MRGSRLG